jgi:hypothetical protein
MVQFGQHQKTNKYRSGTTGKYGKREGKSIGGWCHPYFGISPSDEHSMMENNKWVSVTSRRRRAPPCPVIFEMKCSVDQADLH